ncbi:NIPSNAP family protein [uncultured Eudoraea sp.]|uniref:NIPSNAP family protein n=1 Tax=uncultured Eudoraea sp. TaxID=1035614 RepID=UPI002638FCA9|nr:NIPSNAP family protein [uncultured Eudoraea sp.]
MIKKIALGIVLLVCTFGFSQKEVYEFREYELKFGKSAKVLHDYFEKALIPALNKQGINNIGAFEEIGDAMPKKIYLLIAYNDLDGYQKVLSNLSEDQVFLRASEEYSNTAQEDFPVERYVTSLFTAFDGLPKLVKPAEGSVVFELRTYEAYNEDAFQRKVKMFNESEFSIFDEVGLHSVFFGEKIAGPQMPCLTYLLAFRDMAERDANWSKFGPHPEWQRIVKLPEYANTVSNIYRVFLKPLSYSQL